MMLQNRKSPGFTLIELLVVIAIISLLMTLLFGFIGAGQEEQKKLETKQRIKDLGNALDAYYQKNYSYPDEFKETSPNNSATLPALASGQGYLRQLHGAYNATTNPLGSSRVKCTFSFLSVNNDWVYQDTPTPQSDKMQDVWEFPIEYRIMPLDVSDFRKRFCANNATTSRDHFLQFTSGLTKGRKYHVWSKGPDGLDSSQEYDGQFKVGSPVSLPAGYKSGGYSESLPNTGYLLETYDDIGNWQN